MAADRSRCASSAIAIAWCISRYILRHCWKSHYKVPLLSASRSLHAHALLTACTRSAHASSQSLDVQNESLPSIIGATHNRWDRLFMTLRFCTLFTHVTFPVEIMT